MAVARGKYKPLGVRVVWIAAIADNEIRIATVHHDGIEAQDTTVAGSTNHPFLEGATFLCKQTVDDLHLCGETLWIDNKVGLTTIVVNGELSGNAGSL